MSTISEVIEHWELLEIDDKELILGILQKGFIESKRLALIDRIKEAKANYASGNIRQGSSKDLFQELKNV